MTSLGHVTGMTSPVDSSLCLRCLQVNIVQHPHCCVMGLTQESNTLMNGLDQQCYVFPAVTTSSILY